MAELTKEQLIIQAQENVQQWQHAMLDAVGRDYAAIRLRLAEIALASLTAEPDYILYTCGTCGHDSLSHLHECPECHSRNIHTDALCLMPLLEGLK